MRRSVVFAAALVSAIALPPVAALAAGPSTKTVRDWSAACDNVNACAAFGFATETPEEVFGAWLRISRSGDAAAPATVSVGVTLASGDTPETATVALAFDDASLALPSGPPLRLIPLDDPSLGVDLAPGLGDAVLAGLRKAKGLRLTLSVGGAPVEATISLDGATATLLWLDEQQGRLGTVTALVRRGDKPASAVPPVPPLPVIVRGTPSDKPPPATLPAALRKGLPADCDESGANLDPIIARIDARHVLYGVGCNSGAYNFAYALFVSENGGRAVPVALRAPVATRVPPDILVNPDFDDKSLILQFFTKGRGLGDCGSAGYYVWDGAGFRLAEYTTMDQCYGALSGSWPSLWRAKVE